MMKRTLSILLCLCLMLSVLSPSASAVSTWWEQTGANRQNLLFELLDGSLLDIDLFNKNLNSDLKIEKIEDDQVVKIFIVMDSPSVVETDSKAVYDSKTQKAMNALVAEQAEVLAAIEQQVFLLIQKQKSCL